MPEPEPGRVSAARLGLRGSGSGAQAVPRGCALEPDLQFSPKAQAAGWAAAVGSGNRPARRGGRRERARGHREAAGVELSLEADRAVAVPRGFGRRTSRKGSVGGKSSKPNLPGIEGDWLVPHPSPALPPSPPPKVGREALSPGRVSGGQRSKVERVLRGRPPPRRPPPQVQRPPHPGNARPSGQSSCTRGRARPQRV